MQPTDTVLILGIPLDNLTMEETVDRIHDMVAAYRKDGKPRLVATVNVDFLVNTLSWFSTVPRHPELLGILQHADLVTADGMPLVWASRLLGNPLKERVTGADLVPRLAIAAPGRKLSLYFLGGRGEVARQAAETLKKKNPGMLIAGVDAPFVHVEGEKLAQADEDDAEVIDRINEASPDVLLVAFGNPKQEAWFHRNSHRLKAAVTIGIGGTFEFITGSVSRAPVWMQKAGLEWVYRLTQDPKRLWKRYIIGLFKFTVMVLPIIVQDRWRRFRVRTLRIKTPDTPAFEGTMPLKNELNVVPLPDELDASVVAKLKQQQEEWLAHDNGLVLDFRNVRFIDSSGLGFLLGLWKKGSARYAGFHMAGVQPPVMKTLKLNRVASLLSDHMVEDLDEIVNSQQAPSLNRPFYHTLTATEQARELQLYGALDAAQMQGLDVKQILKSVAARHLIVDLTHLNFVDSTGLILLLKIKKTVASSGHTCLTCGASSHVTQMLRVTRLDHFFPSLQDIQTARVALDDLVLP
ncbi:WecB/TagA/CpsF family glycosyltransferase [Desulfoluna spongiiphila]|uniref:N-acetylmannosaminyltransferase n=1 Tax=Desulfoluna spongiiphila TaxID=419481 RepID=A0A1G5ETG1_9BACT|nr:WecB/TagA/CpsF family glycosyltransferase [Desulfoluna spongiiphila]SCY29960.1 N-acetylmannosaminyltransferase [Desulfoluna spongiiphila]